MSCEYCENSKTMITKKVLDKAGWGWGYDDVISNTLREAEEMQTTLGVFVDRGHIRLADLSDCNCMDHEEKIAIKFCPMCGGNIEAM